MKFESITFNTKDLIMICGGLMSAFGFYMQMDNRFDAFELKMQKIVSDSELNRFELNAKIDNLKHSEKSNKPLIFEETVFVMPNNNDRKTLKLFI